MQNIHREITSENICILRFDRADSSANIFDPATLAELNEHLLALGDKIKGVVFISAKDKVFNAGADLHAIQKMDDSELRKFLMLGQAVFGRVAALSVPTVAAIHGACLGGGYEFALACKYRIASSDRTTKIGLPETKLGILPAWGGTTRLPRLIGVPRALDVILSGKTPAAKQALKLGMIDEIAPRECLLAAAHRAIKRGLPARRMPISAFVGPAIAPAVRARVRRETRGHYPAILKALEIIKAAPFSSVENSLRREREAVLELAKTETCRQLIRLFFLQERARKSTGDARIERVLVIGAGVMGAGIAQWLASRGLRVLLRDVDATRVAAGLARIEKLFGNRRVFTPKEARDGMDRISPITADVPPGQVDLVIEAATEKLELKKQIFARLTGPSLWATNTSALPIAEIAKATSDPGRVVGLHFFNPVHKMQLVEVVAGAQSRSDAVQRAVQFAQQIGKLPVVVKDRPGFVVNRILLPYLGEAGRLFEAGASVTDIDEAMLDFGMPMGPLRLIDEVGVDVAVYVAATLDVEAGVLAKMQTAGLLGRKSGSGFYLFGKKTRVNDTLKQFQTGITAAGLSRQELQRRMVQLMVAEAQACVRDGVATADDVDFAMVMGTGFAPFRGGPLQLKGAD